MRCGAIFLVLLVLTGCTDEQRMKALESQVESQQATIERLRSEETEAVQEREQRIRELERELESLKSGTWRQQQQAGIARACDWLVPWCPPSWIEEGREALANGHTGTWSWWFWIIVLLKLTAVPLAVTGLMAAYVYWVRPARGEVKEVAAELKELQADQAEKAKKLKALDQEIEERQQAAAELDNQVAELQEQEQQLESEVGKLEKRKGKLRGGFE